MTHFINSKKTGFNGLLVYPIKDCGEHTLVAPVEFVESEKQIMVKTSLIHEFAKNDLGNLPILKMRAEAAENLVTVSKTTINEQITIINDANKRAEDLTEELANLKLELAKAKAELAAAKEKPIIPSLPALEKK